MIHLRGALGNKCEKPGASVPYARKGEVTCEECLRLYHASAYSKPKP